jgi:dihydroorotate dehydrogenase
MYGLLRPLLFALSPAAAHTLAVAAMGPMERVGFLRRLFSQPVAPDPRLEVRTMGLTFPHPVGLAGGFDKNGVRVRALAALGFGHLEIGTVTALPQAPNPAPNLFRLPQDRALVNRLGFPNDGAVAVAARLTRGMVPVPMGVSIGKSRVVPFDGLGPVTEDYLASFRAVSPVADFVVVNVSSPNTQGLRVLQGPALARALFQAIQAENGGKLPVLVKIAPDLEDEQVDAVVDAALDEGLAGVVATNTTLSRAGLRTDAATVAAIGAGGLSGPPLFRRALEVVTRVRKRMGKERTLIGVGGISTSEDVRAMQTAGADLVQVYTAFIYGGPGTARALVAGL